VAATTPAAATTASTTAPTTAATATTTTTGWPSSDEYGSPEARRQQPGNQGDTSAKETLQS